MHLAVGAGEGPVFTGLGPVTDVIDCGMGWIGGTRLAKTSPWVGAPGAAMRGAPNV